MPNLPEESHAFCNHHPSRHGLLWYSVSETEFERSRPLQTPFSISELLEKITTLDPDPALRKSATVFGIELLNESVFKIQLLEMLLKYRGQTQSQVEGLLALNPEWLPPQKTYEQKHFNSILLENASALKVGGASNLTLAGTVNSSMDEVLLDQSIFPDHTGPQLAYLRARFNVNASAYTHYGMDFWRAQDLHLIIEALHSFPPHFFDSTHTRENILRFERGAGPKSVVNGDSGIWIYDPWETQTASAKVISFVHELSHVVANRLSRRDLFLWNGISGWKFDAVEQTYKLTAPRTAVSLYGRRNPDEDLAESIVAYRFYPWLMKEKTPEKYEFLRVNVFGQLEYLPENLESSVVE